MFLYLLRVITFTKTCLFCSCLTTEILEGFDVQRTSGMGDTLRKYGHLTQSITEYYKSLGNEPQHQDLPICPSFDQFIERCQELDKMTVSDVFATQLLQVWDIAVIIYATLFSLFLLIVELLPG